MRCTIKKIRRIPKRGLRGYGRNILRIFSIGKGIMYMSAKNHLAFLYKGGTPKTLNYYQKGECTQQFFKPITKNLSRMPSMHYNKSIWVDSAITHKMVLILVVFFSHFHSCLLHCLLLESDQEISLILKSNIKKHLNTKKHQKYQRTPNATYVCLPNGATTRC